MPKFLSKYHPLEILTLLPHFFSEGEKKLSGVIYLFLFEHLPTQRL